MWNGVIIKEVPDMDRFIDTAGNWGSGAADSLATGGATSSRVGVGFLCGAQAVGFGLGQSVSIV